MVEILVLAEHRTTELRPVTLELIARAQELGDHVTVLLIGAHALADALAPLADTVLLAEPAEQAYEAEIWLDALAAAHAARSPALTLLAHTAEGMDLAPVHAEALGLPLVTDCSTLRLGDGALHAVRQVYGGKVIEELALHPVPYAVATLRPGGKAEQKEDQQQRHAEAGGDQAGPDADQHEGGAYEDQLVGEFHRRSSTRRTGGRRCRGAATIPLIITADHRRCELFSPEPCGAGRWSAPGRA